MDEIIPDLRIVPTDLLMPHEWHDHQRSVPLAERLKIEGVLKNPPIVAPLGGGDPRFVVLDGANRYTAATVLGLPHMLVQVVDYDDPRLQISTWFHALTDCALNTFDFALEEVTGLYRERGDLLHARAALARRDILAYVVYAEDRVDLLRADGDLRARTTVLNAMVEGYTPCARLHRTTSDRIAEARQVFDHLMAIVVFPHYGPAEVLELARDGLMLPPGLTRHIIPLRAMRLNYPLARLDSDETLEAKNAALREWIKDRVAAKAVRYYAEATVLFDE